MDAAKAVPCLLSAGAGALAMYLVCRGCAAAPAKCPFSGKTLADAKKEVDDPTESKDIYETEKSAWQYMEFHFTSGKDLFPYDPNMKVSKAFDFTVRLGQIFTKYKPANPKRGLDLGCAVGMSSFEMTKAFDEVVGVDLSNIFIEYANKVKSGKEITYGGPDQGDITVSRTASLKSLSAGVDASKATFVVGDACNVDPALGTFDGLLAANLICRVPEPEKLVRSFAGLVNAGGILVLVSPYSWWDGATAKEKWLGGRPGGPRSEDVVKGILSPDFELLEEYPENWIIRDHVRRFQLGFGHCTIWRRRA